jgi:hypothetical protein
MAKTTASGARLPVNHLYFLLPDLELTHKVVDTLRSQGLGEDDIGIVARDDVDLEDLPEADPSETTDVMPSLRRGAAAGGATGLLAGLAVNIVPGGLALGGLALAGATLAGGAFGAWVSSLVGVSIPNSEVETYREAIDSGQVLLIVHAPRTEHDAIRDAVVGHYPEVVFGGEEHLLPPLR